MKTSISPLIRTKKYEIMNAMDASIRKWENIVYKREFSSFKTQCPLCDISKKISNNECHFCHVCPITIYSLIKIKHKKGHLAIHFESCKKTPFYNTTLWKTYTKEVIKATKQVRKNDNKMLVMLHEIRSWFLLNYFY